MEGLRTLWLHASANLPCWISGQIDVGLTEVSKLKLAHYLFDKSAQYNSFSSALVIKLRNLH